MVQIALNVVVEGGCRLRSTPACSKRAAEAASLSEQIRRQLKWLNMNCLHFVGQVVNYCCDASLDDLDGTLEARTTAVRMRNKTRVSQAKKTHVLQ